MIYFIFMIKHSCRLPKPISYKPPVMSKATAKRITGSESDAQLGRAIDLTRQYVHAWDDQNIPEIACYRALYVAGLCQFPDDA